MSYITYKIAELGFEAERTRYLKDLNDLRSKYTKRMKRYVDTIDKYRKEHNNESSSEKNIISFPKVL